MNATFKFIPLTIALLSVGIPLPAQEQAPTAASTATSSAPATFTNDRLEQMAAPIALYPDALVAQILMASTYPLEIVEAARWVEANPALKGDALEEALKQNEWDPSVKALCGFPTVLKQMNDNIGWTRDLGDAFLAQKTDLMDTIQSMRRKALEAGTLKTTEQQRVVQENGTIVVEPATPEVIYVPTYSPAVVYGPAWYYPTWYYPGWYDPWPWGGGFVSFGVGFFWGHWFWGGCDWHDHNCNIDCDRFNTFNSHTSVHFAQTNFLNAAGRTATWQHNPTHRGGVNYRSAQIAHQFGAPPASTRVMNSQARGVGARGPLTGTRNSPSSPGARAISGGALAAPRMSGPRSSAWSSSSYRAGIGSFQANASPSRSTSPHGGGTNGFRSPSTGRSFAGRGGTSRGGSGSLGGGWRSAGSVSGGGHSGGGFGRSHGGGHH